MVFNHFHQTLHLRSLRGLICICIYLVLQFWRWINDISKVCYWEIQKNTNKYAENNCSEKFCNIRRKTFPWNETASLNKVACYVTLTGNLLLGNLWNFQNSFHKKHMRIKASGISCHWQMFQPNYIFQKISL